MATGRHVKVRRRSFARLMIRRRRLRVLFFFFQAEDGIRDYKVTGVQTCALPISHARRWEKLQQNAMDNAQALFRAGVLLAAGTDAPYPGDMQGEGLHHELELLVEIGRASCRERV